MNVFSKGALRLTCGLLLVAVASAVSAADMKFMSFNICHGCGMDMQTRDGENIARTAARIRAENPDFVGVQEVDWRTARVNGLDEPAELARLTGMQATFAKAIFYAGGQYGVVVLSREKPLSVQKIPLPGSEPRILLLCEFADCFFGTTHLSVASEKERADSVGIIRKAVESCAKTKPVFLSGDWNSTPKTPVLKALDEFLEVVSDTACQTFHGKAVNGPDGQPEDMSRFCIDYIAVDDAHRRDFEAFDAHVVEDRISSDHAPIVASVRFPDPELPSPALVPAPVSLDLGKGLYAAKVSEAADAVSERRLDPALPKEGYRLAVTEKGVVVTSSDAAGAFYAVETLKQLGDFRWGRLCFPCCTVTDAPRFGWRGLHVDDSRHFFGKAAVKRVLDQMAAHKLNVLHWHLTDDEGWRFPVRGRALLTVKGGCRPHSTNQKNLADRFEGGEYGPYAYSADEIREIVAYATARHIRIVPEVDVPGHSRTALRVYPEFGCFAPGDPSAPKGAVDNVLCLGDDEALRFIDDVFDSVCELFPGEIVHIGGDEVNKTNWKSCPKCAERARKLGLKDPAALQAWLAERISARLAEKGRRIIGWDEIILDGKAPQGAVVMSWRGAKGGIAAAKAGLDCVMTPHDYCYFDYDQCIRDDPATYPWFTHRLPLARVYSYDPLAGMPSGSEARVLGGQCCNWAEYTCNETELQWKMWPRACATAEVFWSPAAARDFADFTRRMQVHRRRLIAAKVNCAPLE